MEIPNSLDFCWEPYQFRWNHKHSNHQMISTFGGPIFPVQQLSSNLARCWLNSANSTATIISGCVLCLLSETIIDLVENWPAGWRRWFELVSTCFNWSDLQKIYFQSTGNEWNKATYLILLRKWTLSAKTMKNHNRYYLTRWNVGYMQIAETSKGFCCWWWWFEICLVHSALSWTSLLLPVYNSLDSRKSLPTTSVKCTSNHDE